jgi:rhamnosyltransferase
MRSHNDMPLIKETLIALHRQNSPFELLTMDNESTDGTLEEIKKYTDRIINIPQGKYIPGRVLNNAMENSDGEYVVFLNSDCPPQDEDWLKNLLGGFKGDNVASVFGRQIPRKNCKPLFSKDTEDTYGDGSRQKKWKHCFSMASSSIRRSVWKKLKFNEYIRYSEDIEWTWRARQEGYSIAYVPNSIVMHSHNYTFMQFYKRHYGEGRAEAVIYDWPPWERSFFRYSVLPYARQLSSDWKYCLSHGHIGSFFYSPALRMAQLLGRRAGFNSAFDG